MFLVWVAWAPGNFVSSFLIGWLLKVATMRFGGSQAFQRMKPIMIGIVAGELVGAMIPIAFGLLYWLATGEMPKPFNIFPG